MKKTIATAAAIAALTISAGTGAVAADKSKMGEDKVFVSTMDEAATSSGPGVLLPLLLITIVAAAVASD